MTIMKALSIRAPWWWFILEGSPLKDVENRNWNDQYARVQLQQIKPGQNFQIHAAKGFTEKEYDEAIEFARKECGVTQWPSFQYFREHAGGIVGVVEYVGAYRHYKSPWFTGPLGIVMRNPITTMFVPCKGQLGFFEPETERN